MSLRALHSGVRGVLSSCKRICFSTHLGKIWGIHFKVVSAVTTERVGAPGGWGPPFWIVTGRLCQPRPWGRGQMSCESRITPARGYQQTVEITGKGLGILQSFQNHSALYFLFIRFCAFFSPRCKWGKSSDQNHFWTTWLFVLWDLRRRRNKKMSAEIFSVFVFLP